MQIDETQPGKTDVFEPRHLGGQLLVAQLGHDALGTVYRALDSADERRFVRLRVLQSGDLDPEALLAAIQKNSKIGAMLHNEAIVRRAQFGVADGVPFMAWYETAGWTLDTVLARVRALKLQISTEHALLIAERVATALEYAHRTVVEGTPIHHGLLWPGFICVSNDADVRVGGFGLAEAVLPSLHKPRLANEIAPYVAPEAREGREARTNSDAYSLGVLLSELLTCRRPSLAEPPASLRAGDAFSQEIGAFLRLCLAPPAERFQSAVEMRRALKELLAASPFSLSPASLALFLYRLLNPESQSAPDLSDGEATVPVILEPVPALVPSFQSPLVGPSTVEIGPLPLPRPGIRRPRRAGVALVLFLAIASGALLLMRRPRSQGEPASDTPPARAAQAPVPLPSGKAPARDPIAGDVPVSPLDAVTPPLSARKRSPADPEALAGATAIPVNGDLVAARTSARNSRFQAGLARIEAERIDAPLLAADLFGEGRDREREGDRLARASDYDAARLAFSQAARHFRQAEGLSREERARRLDLASIR